MRILFVCTGNTCRSPMAAAFTRVKLAERGLPWSVQSAGVSAGPGLPMSPQAVQVLKRHHIDGVHQSQPLDAALVADADVILTMTGAHKGLLLSQFPQAADKAFELLRYISDEEGAQAGRYDIVDPFGGSVEDYEVCARELNQAIDRLLDKLEAKVEIDRLESGGNA